MIPLCYPAHLSVCDTDFDSSMGQLVRMMSTWQLSAHRRRVAVLADQARGATADMPVTGQADASNPKGPFVQIRSPDHDQAPDHVGVDLPRLQVHNPPLNSLA